MDVYERGKIADAIQEETFNKGDKVIVHHNVFRRWHNQHGIEKNSKAYVDEDTYLVQPDQIFLYKDTEWQAQKGYCFVAPVKSTDKYSVDKEKPLVLSSLNNLE